MVFKGYKMGIILGYDLFTNKMLGMLWDMGVSWDVSKTIKKKHENCYCNGKVCSWGYLMVAVGLKMLEP